MPVEFTTPAAELSQGDLLSLAPAIYVRDLGFMVRLDADRFRLQEEPPGTLTVEAEHQANAIEVRRKAIVLTHGCEIDKDTRSASVLLALVRELAGVPDEYREGFRQYTRHRAFYLPPDEFLSDESYADLRAITTIRRDALDQLERIASMNDQGRELLQAHIFRFFARRLLPAEWTQWDSEE